MYLVGLLFGFGEALETDELTVTESESRVRHCIVDRGSSDICNSKTWTGWRRYQSRPHYRAPREHPRYVFGYARSLPRLVVVHGGDDTYRLPRLYTNVVFLHRVPRTQVRLVCETGRA